MIKIKYPFLIIALCALFISTSLHAEGFIKKEVYSFKDVNGNIVFTDRKPAKKKTFKTQTIEAANSTANNQDSYTSQASYNQRAYSNNTVTSPQTVRVIVEDRNVTKKKVYKKKRSLKRCKSYKKRLAYYSDKMKSGYKNSEYKNLESNRKKYKNLLFNNCETKTFND